MKYLLFALIILAACVPIADTRPPHVASMTRTAIAQQPVTGNHGYLRVRLLVPPLPRVEPKVLPDWEYEVTPTPEVSE